MHPRAFSPFAAVLICATLASGPLAPISTAEAQTRKPVGGTELTLDLPQRSASTPQGTVELIAASGQPTPAGELWLALRYQLNPGWHIYWTNPGDSGGPPQVTWQLPAGAKAGPFEWPTPTRIPLEQLMNFGYENIVTLPLKVSLPAAAARAGAPLHVGAALKWLVCKDICVSGKADLALDLPLSADERGQLGDWQKSISSARAAVPVPAPKTWQTSARAEGDTLLLTIVMDRPAPSKAAFFPQDTDVIENAAPQDVSTAGRELRLRLRKASRPKGSPSTLRGVLTFAPGQPSVTIAAPLTAGPGARTAK